MTDTIYVPSTLVARHGYVRTGRKLKPDHRVPYEQKHRDGNGEVRYMDHRGFEHVWRDKQGPWWASYSAQAITEGRLQRPFSLAGKYYVAMGSSPRVGDELYPEQQEAWHIIPLDEWRVAKWGRTCTYYEKVDRRRRQGDSPGAYARSDPRGFYHGMTGKWRGQTWVILGPAVTLIVDDTPRVRQLTLFEFLD